ncbi:mucin-5AC-like [Daphnia carinata]|uniref:mucin-5AC-like n=1 Tax=Daphnia carinata TaxID=120202 RepID=UPI00257F70F0|nr:mucin-5AC-like [Daphnia carinata]
MIYLQITFCVLFVVSSVRSMPVANVEETSPTEWTHDITTEEATAATWLAPESLAKEILDAGAADVSSPDDNNKSPATTTTEEPFNAVTDRDEPTVWSPSQTVEIRLHPQSLRTGDVKTGEEHPEEVKATSTTVAPSSVAPAQEDVFGQRTVVKPQQQQQQQQQQQHGSFSGVTGRLRSRDSVGAALRRAVTGSPAVQKLQQSTTRMASLPISSGRGKAGAITGRKIVGFGSLSNLPSIQRVPAKSFFKNRQTGHGHGGDTPADTHMEPSPQWLYGTSKDTRKAVESFRLSNNERLLVLGLRDKVMTTTTTVSNQEAEIVTSTTSKPEEAASTTTLFATTTTVQPPVSEQMAVTEIKIVESTTARPEVSESVTQESNDVPLQMSDATPKANDAIPEINNETSERTHEKAEGHVTSTELVPHAETVSTLTASSTETNPFTSSKTKFEQIPLDEKAEPIKSLDNSPIDGQASSKQELGSLPASDDCFGADCNGDQETGLNMGQLDHGGFDEEAHRYLVEEKTHDGYIIGEFGVVSRSSDLRAVRYTAHGSIDPQLIQEMLRTFWLLKTGEKE